MVQVWEYRDATGTVRRGYFIGSTERSGADVTYRFHRLDGNGSPIEHCIDLVSGAALRHARNITQRSN